MKNKEILEQMPTEDLITELINRHPAGLVLAFLTDDPSYNRKGFTEYFKSHGPHSVQRGLSATLADYIEESFGGDITSIEFSDNESTSIAPGSDGLNDFFMNLGNFDDDEDDEDDDDKPWED